MEWIEQDGIYWAICGAMGENQIQYQHIILAVQYGFYEVIMVFFSLKKKKNI